MNQKLCKRLRREVRKEGWLQTGYQFTKRVNRLDAKPLSVNHQSLFLIPGCERAQYQRLKTFIKRGRK